MDIWTDDYMGDWMKANMGRFLPINLALLHDHLVRLLPHDAPMEP